MEARKTAAPPTPPPMPQASSSPKLLGSNGAALKLASAHPDWETQYLASLKGSPPRDPFVPGGWYFLFGTLRDPSMLSEILDLPSAPQLRPAYMIGYTRRKWGQYPALVDGPCGSTVQGSAFYVPDENAAAKLAYYETDNYQYKPCNIRFDDGAPDVIRGFTFMFAGNVNDLSDGDFDLDTWLRQMGRKPVDV
ncbi:MAG: hypothetical protein M1828_001923 [Chrysothrix sp. TS-e1954]|nr:MAG: hypothetical protein M1828_001923 [Chrysothrix sp. TS-e1954]